MCKMYVESSTLYTLTYSASGNRRLSITRHLVFHVVRPVQWSPMVLRAQLHQQSASPAHRQRRRQQDHPVQHTQQRPVDRQCLHPGPQHLGHHYNLRPSTPWENHQSHLHPSNQYHLVCCNRTTRTRSRCYIKEYRVC